VKRVLTSIGWSWAWADLPALLLGMVRAATVTAGALLIRGGLPWQVFAVLGVAVAGLALVVERQVTDRLNNPLNPQQSLTSLIACWLPTLAIAVTLNALTAFAVLAPSVSKRELDRSHQEYWRSEATKTAEWTLVLRTSAARLVEAKQQEVDTEQLRLAAARRERVPYSTDALSALRRELTKTREVLRNASAIQSLPITAPPDTAEASKILQASLRGLTDVYVSSSGFMPTLSPPPVPVLFEPPIVDLPTMFVHETMAWQTSAMVGWAIAVALEALSFIALWRGGRRVALAARVREWWRRGDELKNAILRRDPPVNLPIILQPMGLAGSVFLNVAPDFSLDDCMPRLEETLTKHPDVADKRIASIAAAAGRTINKYEPLVPQLAGGRLVITLEEA
jgi:hypothetical protein